jgi:hypothetical protein
VVTGGAASDSGARTRVGATEAAASCAATGRGIDAAGADAVPAAGEVGCGSGAVVAAVAALGA